MPIVGDLGFAYAAAALAALAAIVFEVRRRWRRSVARREEVRRLVAEVAAEEEAARARFESSSSVYVPIRVDTRPIRIDTGPIECDSRRAVVFQCALCLLPANTRCARCKAVRYCSGKCQILHWRESHKNECRPFTAAYQHNNEGGGSIQKVPFPQEGSEIHTKGFESEQSRSSGSVKKSELKTSPVDLFENRGDEAECLADVVERGSSFDENGKINEHQSNDDHIACSDKPNKMKPSRSNHDVRYGSKGSSSFNADGTTKILISDPQVPFSGFWEGTLNSNLSKDDSTDDFAQPSSPFKFHNKSDPSARVKDSEKPVDVNIQSDEESVCRSTWSEKSNGIRMCNTSDLAESVLKETSRIERSSISALPPKHTSMKPPNSQKENKVINGTGIIVDPNISKKDEILSSASVVNLRSVEAKHTVQCAKTWQDDNVHTSDATSFEIPSSLPSSKNGFKTSMRPPNSQKENKVINGTGIIVDPNISKKDEILSSASVVNLHSVAAKHTVQCAKTGKDDNLHTSDVTSFEIPSSLPSSKNGFKTSMRKVVDQLRVSKSPQQSRVGSEITGRHIEKGLFSYEHFVKLYHWKKVEQLQPFGLLNCGNSCYANAVLQCLACTPPLTAYFLQGLHCKACKWKEWCFTCEFQSLMLRGKEGNSPLSPAAILSHLHKLKSHFGNGKEEDAHEFLRFVIDTMQTVSLSEVGVRASGSLEEETTLIGLTFGGYLRSKIKCMKCGAKSEHDERLMDLTVEIEGDIGTLEESLRKFTSTEILDGDNKYQCSRCRSYERAKKKFRVLEAPNVLTITLKRFQSGEFGKLNKWIRFPEILDLAPFMSGTSDKSPIYRLYGVIVHLDSMNATYSGHYVCYVKNAENRWFEIDDSRVKPVDLESVLANRAYMLLYARCSPRAPKLIKNLMTRDFKKSKGPPMKSRSHSIGSWNVPTADPSYNYSNGIESLDQSDTSFHSVRMVFEEDSCSENASSIFSEECSCSTESSNRDYSGTDDHLDSIFGNYRNDRNASWRNSSDSESPSSSSSSSGASLSPIYSTGKSSAQILECDSTKYSKKLGGVSSSSCRETHSNRLGWANPFGNKKPGLLFRRSVRERTS